MDSFTSDDKWLDIFGERLILQKAGRYGIISSCRKGIFIFNAVY